MVLNKGRPLLQRFRSSPSIKPKTKFALLEDIVSFKKIAHTENVGNI